MSALVLLIKESEVPYNPSLYISDNTYLMLGDVLIYTKGLEGFIFLLNV